MVNEGNSYERNIANRKELKKKIIQERERSTKRSDAKMIDKRQRIELKTLKIEKEITKNQLGSSHANH